MQSAPFAEKSSSLAVSIRGTVRLNGTGVIRLVVPDGTSVKEAIQAPAKTTGNHLFRSSKYLWSFISQGQLRFLKADINETSKTVT